MERKFGYLKDGEYFSDEVRRVISKSLGEDAVFEGGLMVRTTIDPALQQLATKVFRRGLLNYDRRHGFRGATARIDLNGDYKDALKKRFCRQVRKKLAKGGRAFGRRRGSQD